MPWLKSLTLSQGILPEALAGEYIFEVQTRINRASQAGIQTAGVGYLSRELGEVGLQVMV